MISLSTFLLLFGVALIITAIVVGINTLTSMQGLAIGIGGILILFVGLIWVADERDSR